MKVGQIEQNCIEIKKDMLNCYHRSSHHITKIDEDNPKSNARRANDVGTMPKSSLQQRNDLISTKIRRSSNVMCPQGCSHLPECLILPL